MAKIRIALGALVVTSLLLTGVALAQGTPSIERWVIAGGGGSGASNGIRLSGTLGQWAVGSGEAGAAYLGAGFWGGGVTGRDVYLPLVARGA